MKWLIECGRLPREDTALSRTFSSKGVETLSWGSLIGGNLCIFAEKCCILLITASYTGERYFTAGEANEDHTIHFEL